MNRLALHTCIIGNTCDTRKYRYVHMHHSPLAHQLEEALLLHIDLTSSTLVLLLCKMYCDRPEHCHWDIWITPTWVVGCGSWVVGSWVVGHGLWVMGCGVMGCGSWVCGLWGNSDIPVTVLLFVFLLHRPVLLDILAAVQTPASQKALMEFLNFQDESNIELPERYLLATAFVTHPDDKLLKELLVSGALLYLESMAMVKALPNYLFFTGLTFRSLCGLNKSMFVDVVDCCLGFYLHW